MSEGKSKFIVSARKYRPTAWDEVVGQEAITSTLTNAIAQEQLAHAYLFCGPRGVGKTTCARIFAKEINRDENHDEDEDFAFNIFELDAASNNKVEDIRNLIDQVRIPPQVGRYKVYIIDEVHMLSAQAFNAFLKTLEEPPEHAIFILATTEKHKIIPTILSRCQIYDFNRIGVDEIATHLRGIAEQEKIAFEDEALHVIGLKADGALRDALSIFDQLSSFTHRNLSYEAVVKNLHVLDYDYHFKMVASLHKENYQDALLLLDEILRLGFDGAHFLSGFASHLRDLLVAKDERTARLLEVGDNVKQQYFDQASGTETWWISEALKLCNKTDVQYRNSGNQRLLLEVLLLSVSTLQQEKKNGNSEVNSDGTQAAPKAPTSIKASGPTPQPTQVSQEVQSSPPAQPLTPIREEPAPPAAEENDSPPASEEPQPYQTTEPQKQTAPAEAKDVDPQSTSAARKPRRSGPRRTTSISLDAPVQEPTPAPEPLEIVEEPEASYGNAPAPEAASTSDMVNPAETWKKLAIEVLESGRSALHAILSRQNIDEQMEGTNLNIKLLHEVEATEFDAHKTDLLGRFRELSGNAQLGFTYDISPQHTEAKLFGAKEKFAYLAEKNPLLHKLKSELDLDVN